MKSVVQTIYITLFLISFSLKGQVPLQGNINLDNNGSLYWAGTMAFSAINLTTTYFNIKKMHKYDKYRSNAIFGAISGAAQTAIGFASINTKYNNAYIPTSMNIGIGLTTLVTSVVRLATKNPPKDNSLSINFIYLQNSKDVPSMVGLLFKKQF